MPLDPRPLNVPQVDGDETLQVTVALNNYRAFSAFPTTLKRQVAATGWYERSV